MTQAHHHHAPRRPYALRKRPPPGSPPGTFVAPSETPPATFDLIAYGPETLTEERLDDTGTLGARIGRQAVTWVDVAGLGDAERVRQVSEVVGLHPLALEDVMHLHQRSKVESYEDRLFIVVRMPHAEGRLDSEQISLVLGHNFLVTFQERPGDSFEPVRERLRRGAGRIRSNGADYLAYALIDATIDSYFPILETLGEKLENLEVEVSENPSKQTVARLHLLKRDLVQLRRAIWPARETLNALLRDEHRMISDNTRVYLRDCYDHTVQLIDMLELYRDIAASLFDIYLSSLSQRTNEVMKVLTVIATIFIPLGFIASLYGMNFDTRSAWNMPELGWRFGYPAVLLLMAAVALGLVVWFRMKGWIGGPARRRRRSHLWK